MFCDIGMDVSKFKEEFVLEKVDFVRVREGWNDKKNKDSWVELRVEKLMVRFKEVRRVIRELVGEGDYYVVVVIYGVIVYYIIDDWVDIFVE